MADSVTPAMPDVAIAGLRIPADLAFRIIRALRATYPTLVDGRDDEGVVRAVLIHWITTTLAAHERGLVEESMTEAVDSLRAEYIVKSRQAAEKAHADSGRIREAEVEDVNTLPIADLNSIMKK